MRKTLRAFTLIEVIISVTIFSIVFVSVITSYILLSKLNQKIDMSRAMQENIKNITETIAEDVRKNWIKFCNPLTPTETECHTIQSGQQYTTENVLYTHSWRYSLRKYDSLIPAWENIDIWDPETECTIPYICKLYKSWSPLSNTWVQFKTLRFSISNTLEPKVTINFVLSPAFNKWINPDLIKNNVITFQTTVSERPYKDY